MKHATNNATMRAENPVLLFCARFSIRVRTHQTKHNSSKIERRDHDSQIVDNGTMMRQQLRALKNAPNFVTHSSTHRLKPLFARI